jgi:hypothetical protein
MHGKIKFASLSRRLVGFAQNSPVLHGTNLLQTGGWIRFAFLLRYRSATRALRCAAWRGILFRAEAQRFRRGRRDSDRRSRFQSGNLILQSGGASLNALRAVLPLCDLCVISAPLRETKKPLSYMAKICSRLMDGTGCFIPSLSFRHAGLVLCGRGCGYGSRGDAEARRGEWPNPPPTLLLSEKYSGFGM